MRACDQDQDRVITEAEAGELWEALAGADKGGDGKLTVSEMLAARSNREAHEGAGQEPLTREEYAKAISEIKRGVAGGKLSESETRSQLQDLRKRIGREPEQREPSPEEVIRKIHAAVEAGKQTPDEAKAKLEAYQQELAKMRAAEQELQAALEQLKAKLKEDVKSGRMTPEEAQQRLEAFPKSHGEKRRKAGREQGQIEH